MAWKKTPPEETAKTSNDDIRITLYRIDGVIRSEVEINTTINTDEQGPQYFSDLPITAALDATERANLIAYLIKLRDAGLTDAGFADIP